MVVCAPLRCWDPEMALTTVMVSCRGKCCEIPVCAPGATAMDWQGPAPWRQVLS